MMGQTGIPVNIEYTVVQDYGFPLWLENSVMALICPVWLGAWRGWVVALLMWLVCCWVGPLARWFPVGPVKSFDEPHSIESSHVGRGSCALCYSCQDFQYPVYLLTFWGWLMGPHGSLSLRGCSAPHWNLELGLPEDLSSKYFKAYQERYKTLLTFSAICCCMKL